MLITTTPANTSAHDNPARLWTNALLAGLAAAATTTTAAGLTHAFGSPPAVSGEEVPLYAFAQLTLMGALLGAIIAKVISTRLRHPRRAFLRIACVLTVISIVPDVVVDATIGSRLTLAFTHVVAAAVIVPALARRLAR